MTLEKTFYILTTFNRKKMVLTEINKEWPPDEDIPSFRQRNMEELLKLSEFVRRLSEGEGSSKFLFQKCGFGPKAIREMVMSHMRERRRKEKDSSIVGVQSSGDIGGYTESVESSSSNDSPPSTQSAQSAADKRKKEYGDYFHPCKFYAHNQWFFTVAVSFIFIFDRCNRVGACNQTRQSW